MAHCQQPHVSKKMLRGQLLQRCPNCRAGQAHDISVPHKKLGHVLCHCICCWCPLLLHCFLTVAVASYAGRCPCRVYISHARSLPMGTIQTQHRQRGGGGGAAASPPTRAPSDPHGPTGKNPGEQHALRERHSEPGTSITAPAHLPRQSMLNIRP